MKDDIVPPRPPRVMPDAPDKLEKPEKPDLPDKPDDNPLIPLEEKPKDIAPNKAKKPKPRKKSKFDFLKRLKKTHWALIGLSLVVIIGCGAAFIVTRPDPVPDPEPVIVKEEEPPKPATVASPLTGIQVTPEEAKLPTTGVMIENSPDARPQAGLREAGVVFEAIAEGGITRFLAIYQESMPAHIGPVRSVRPYFLDFVTPFDAPLGHAGGSAQALAEIRNQRLKDLDHSGSGATYSRVSNRFAPHNLYTSRAKLLELQRSKGYKTSKFTGFPRKEDKPAETPNARAVDLSISSMLYNVRFNYDAKSNSYLRIMAGRPHLDEKSAKQINPKVVIALVSPHRYAGIYSVYKTTGSGKVYVFQDGTVTEGTWRKNGRSNQFTFTDAKGEPIELNAGQTWITLVGDEGKVRVTP